MRNERRVIMSRHLSKPLGPRKHETRQLVPDIWGERAFVRGRKENIRYILKFSSLSRTDDPSFSPTRAPFVT